MESIRSSLESFAGYPMYDPYLYGFGNLSRNSSWSATFLRGRYKSGVQRFRCYSPWPSIASMLGICRSRCHPVLLGGLLSPLDCRHDYTITCGVQWKFSHRHQTWNLFKFPICVKRVRESSLDLISMTRHFSLAPPDCSGDHIVICWVQWWFSDGHQMDIYSLLDIA